MNKADIYCLKQKLNKDSEVEFDICPAGGHNYNKKVERTIGQIKEFFEKSIQKFIMGNSIISDSEMQSTIFLSDLITSLVIMKIWI